MAVLPAIGSNRSSFVQYEIIVKERNTLPKEELPCHRDGEQHGLLVLTKN